MGWAQVPGAVWEAASNIVPVTQMTVPGRAAPSLLTDRVLNARPYRLLGVGPIKTAHATACICIRPAIAGPQSTEIKSISFYSWQGFHTRATRVPTINETQPSS